MAGRVTFETVPEPEPEQPEQCLDTVREWTGDGIPAWANVRSEPCVTPECSRCGDTNDGDFVPHYDSISEALDAVRGSDWALLTDGRLLCSSCVDTELCDKFGHPKWSSLPGWTIGDRHYPERWWCSRCGADRDTDPEAA